VSDRIAEDQARAFHIGRTPPVVSHYVYVQTPETPHDNGTAQPAAPEGNYGTNS
jgi:hypothetical protein